MYPQKDKEKLYLSNSFTSIASWFYCTTNFSKNSNTKGAEENRMEERGVVWSEQKKEMSVPSQKLGHVPGDPYIEI